MPYIKRLLLSGIAWKYHYYSGSSLVSGSINSMLPRHHHHKDFEKKIQSTNTNVNVDYEVNVPPVVVE